MIVTKTVVVEVPGLGDVIRELRIRDPRSLSRICREIGMTTGNWYRIEDEKQTVPIETLKRIEKALGVDFGVSFESDT